MGLKETFAFAHKLITEDGRIFAEEYGGMPLARGCGCVCLQTYHRGRKDFRRGVSFTSKKYGGMPLV